MARAFEDEIEALIKLMQAYDHLVEHDQLDCSAKGAESHTWRDQMSCNFRRYLMTILMMTFILIGFVCYYRRR